jgi:hypothetical protein
MDPADTAQGHPGPSAETAKVPQFPTIRLYVAPDSLANSRTDLRDATSDPSLVSYLRVGGEPAVVDYPATPEFLAKYPVALGGAVPGEFNYAVNRNAISSLDAAHRPIEGQPLPPQALTKEAFEEMVAPAAPEVKKDVPLGEDGKPVEMTADIVNLDAFEAFVTKMNRRAAKLGVPPISYKVGKAFFREQAVITTFSNEASRQSSFAVKVNPVTVSTTPIKLPGDWSFAARIDHEKSGNIIASVPGIEKLPDRFQTAPCICEHCRTDRTRNQTYVVQNLKDKRHVQVGTDCMKDFLGQESPEHIMQQLAFFSSIFNHVRNESARDYDSSQGTRGWEYVKTAEVLKLASCVIRQSGYVSTAKESDAYESGVRNVFSTRTAVSNLLEGNPAWRDRYNPTEEDEAKAQEVLAWARNDLAPRANKSDYENNLAVSADGEFVSRRHLGYLVSAEAQMSRERDVARKQKEKPVSAFVGRVKERADFAVTMERIIPLGPDAYSGKEKYFYVFRDAAGNTLKWGTDLPAPCKEGQAVCLTGTIKDHTTYNNRRLGTAEKQTSIKNCKVIEAVKNPPSAYVEVLPPGAAPSNPKPADVEIATNSARLAQPEMAPALA